MFYKLLELVEEVKFQVFKLQVKKYGIYAPILISNDGLVLDGNKRLRAAKELCLNSIPVVIVSNVVVCDPADFGEKTLRFRLAK